MKTREITGHEIDAVAGGMESNYQYCANGPAGEGVYPYYIDCGGPTWKEIFQAWADLGKGSGGKA
jgi:hypothetical protein